LWAEGIPLVGAVDGDFSHPLGFMIEDILILFDGLPFHLHSQLGQEKCLDKKAIFKNGKTIKR
jgi:hypothetical protein